MPNPRTQAARERARRDAKRQEELRRSLRATRRKQVAVGVFGVTLIVALVAGLVVAGSKGTTTTTAGSTTSMTSTTVEGDLSGITVPEGEPAALPAVAPGASISGSTPCPAADGSSPRTTSFAEAPPTCIATDRDHTAVVRTSVGDLTLLLNPKVAPVSVNNFVVLARYHFWDGAPITGIQPRVAFQVQQFIAGGPPSPGYTIDNDSPPQGTLQIVGSPSFVVPQSLDGRIDPGRFQMALGEEAAGLPKNTPVLGILLDDGAREGGDPGTLQAIRKAGSTDGQPTQVITITGIDVTEEPARPG